MGVARSGGWGVVRPREARRDKERRGSAWRLGTGEARRDAAGSGGYGVEICGEVWWELAVEAWRVTD